MTKNVRLADDAYAALARLKKPGQSFSDVVRELVRRRPSILEVSGLFAKDSRYWDGFARKRRRARRKTKLR